MEFLHEPVLVKEVLQALNVADNGLYIDCTLGGAGHSMHILASGKNIRLVGIDQDPVAIEAASNRLKGFKEQVTIVNDNFRNIHDIVRERGIPAVDGILMDIGVSSPQLDDGERGFSYQHDAALDMRMSPDISLTAARIVNSYSAAELSDLFWKYGEEKWSARVAQFIVEARTIKYIATTTELVEIIKAAIPAGARRVGPHPAKRIFQALRIEVNQELAALDEAIFGAVDVLKPGGKLAIITFHSLEDRIVKKNFQQLAGVCHCPPNLPMCVCTKEKKIRVVNRKPIQASAEELENNPRARSAKLRVAERL